MVMAEYFIPDRLQDLWQQIHHLHLTYLDTEDSPQKIEQRNKLEACIRDYLCIAPHNRKFYCPETAEVLHRSASSKKDFSGYRAALAWNAVSMYAGNLLSQPWRKEYRQIKTYCGFYKHQIEANLVGAEAMFEAMGYKHAGDGILILEGPVCPDRVANVSQDSIVAFVECQILKTIWEEVSNNFKVSWLDVLEFRETHFSSPEQSVRILNYRFHERRYQEQHRSYPNQSSQATDPTYSTLLRFSGTSSSHLPHHPPQHTLPHVVTHAPPLTGMHSFPPPAHSHYAPLQPSPTCPSQCIYGNPYYNTYSYAPVPQNPYPRYGTVPFHASVLPCTAKQPCNGYCYPNGCVPPSSYICPVPTAQLIELDNPHSHPQNHQNGVYDVPDSASKRQQDLESHKQLAKSTNLDSLTLSKSKEDGAGTFESWDYVYRNLESQGYSKDLGERPDILQSGESTRKRSLREKRAKPVVTSVELEDEFNTLNLNTSHNQSEYYEQSDGPKKYPESNRRLNLNAQDYYESNDAFKKYPESKYVDSKYQESKFQDTNRRTKNDGSGNLYDLNSAPGEPHSGIKSNETLRKYKESESSRQLRLDETPSSPDAFSSEPAEPHLFPQQSSKQHQLPQLPKMPQISKVQPPQPHQAQKTQQLPQLLKYQSTNQDSHQDSAPTTASKSSITNGISKSSKTLPRDRLILPEKPNHATTLDARKLRKQDVDKIKPKDVKSKEKEVKFKEKPKENAVGWNCNTCTYLNDGSVEICAICGKSKKNVEVMMAVGGSQCPRCTLVNPKEETVCQACDASLLNSPTYI